MAIRHFRDRFRQTWPTEVLEGEFVLQVTAPVMYRNSMEGEKAPVQRGSLADSRFPHMVRLLAITVFALALVACDLNRGGTAVCPYTNDGECDEPYVCKIGTDVNDCRNDTPPPRPTGKVLDVPIVAQQTEVWCWQQ